ncbi:TetR/AcrR family transcriptional regulator [Nonomuraea terrae]|uniref:TetR/AcrR family transcriptional regulator n=1 Tax=Nonomuraea terrae TaxID=2530383 RepID=UPI0037A3585F
MASETRTFVEEARRAQIIGCAIDVLADEGYAQATMARIAKQAKISPGAISYHFGGKAPLIDAVVSDVARMATDMMVPRILAQPTATEGLRAYVEANLDFMRQHRKPLLALMEIITHAPRESGGPGPYDRQAEIAVRDLEKVLEWGQRTGEFRDFDRHTMAVALRGVIDAVAGHLIPHPDWDFDLLARELVTTLTLATRR